MKQTATALQQIPVDMTYGFPGEIPKLKGIGRTKQLLEFFVLVAQGVDNRKAAAQVGYSVKWGKQYSYGYTKKYADYLQWLQAHYAQAVVKTIGIDQERVLEEIETIAMANLADYIVLEGAGPKATQRFKRLDELTKDQMRAVEPVSSNGNLVGWKFRDRDGKLTELAKTMGLLNEKVILEHRHRHLHVHADLSKTPIKELEDLEARYEKILLIGRDDGEPDAVLERPRKNGNGKGHDV